MSVFFDLSIGACRVIFRNRHAQATDAEACQCPSLIHIEFPHRKRKFSQFFLELVKLWPHLKTLQCHL
ncbi:unnamed protein product [Albugo candida]|uniref:Uncharacterized protein n=1 Tax=Albugo candida TaxID=65357 RepID=A0A024FV12_9STRA|nr:unnamed protein product [Albugo candida]|eukprot:CCI10772.1 unnamed protein product [Albugo candida]